MLPELMVILQQVTGTLERLGVRYAIGGSLASAVHGVVRATLDADIVAELRPEHAVPLVEALGQAFYADLEMIQQAISNRTSFNLLHLETMFKVDVFVSSGRPLEQGQLNRRQLHQLSVEPEQTAYIVSPEDIVLAKLAWYRLGGGVSERQWQDVGGVLRVQGNRLDLDYLRRLAVELGLTDLLEEALAEVGG